MTTLPEYHPRGLVCTSGERLPDCSRSIYGRMLLLETRRDDVDLEALTSIQADSVQLREAMAGYLHYLSQRPPEFGAGLLSQHEQLRRQLHAQPSHLRTPDIVAHLCLGLHCFGSFATSCGAMPESHVQQTIDEGARVLREAGHLQTSQLDAVDPVEQYLETLRTVLTQGTSYLEPLEAGVQTGFATRGGDLIGWVDGENVYLLPRATNRAVAHFHQESSELFPFSDRDIRRILKERGITACDPNRNTKRKRIPQHGTEHVFQICRDRLDCNVYGDDDAEDATQVLQVPSETFLRA